MSTDKDQRFIDAVERGMPTAMAAQAVYGTAVPPRPPAPEPECGVTFRAGSGRYYDCGRAPHTTGVHAICDPAPAAPDATAEDELRAVPTCACGGPCEHDGSLTREKLFHELHDEFHDHWHLDQPSNLAASVLALPALRDVLAAAARDAEKVRRVEAECAEEVAWVAEYPAYEITVAVPKEAGQEIIDRMFEAVGDAAYEAQPEDRGEWDIFVSGSGDPASVPLHKLRAALDVP